MEAYFISTALNLSLVSLPCKITRTGLQIDNNIRKREQYAHAVFPLHGYGENKTNDAAKRVVAERSPKESSESGSSPNTSVKLNK